MSRLKIMHVLDQLGVAGTECVVMNIVNRLDPERFESGICCLRRALPLSRSRVERIPVIELHRREGFDRSLIAALARIFRRERVDIVQSHNWSTYVYAVLAARIAGVPVVIHGEHGRETQSPIRTIKRRLVQRALSSGVDRFIAVSRDIRDAFDADWGLDPSRVSLIANGVDTAPFDETNDVPALRRALGIAPDDRVVGTVGGIRPVKNHEMLLRAFARMRRGRRAVKLLIVGHDPKGAFQQRVRAMAPEWGLAPDDVVFTGIRSDIPRLLTAMDVYVNSSLFEGTSNAILEAMAARKPVVATAVGGNVDLVDDGVNGWLVPPHDLETMAERIGRLLDDPAAAQEMGRRGRARVEREFDFDRMVAEHVALYEELSARHRVRWGLKERAKYGVTVLCRASGVRAAVEGVRGGALTILSYHRVLPLHEKLQTPCQGMIVAKDVFERQIATLAREYQVLSLSEAMRHFRHRIAFPSRAVLVTFDDGYADTYHHGLPILMKYGVPATFFLTTGPIDSGRWFWWDRLDWAVRTLHRDQAGRAVDRSHAPPGVAAALAAAVQSGTIAAVDRLVVELNRVEATLRERLIADWSAEAVRRGGEPTGRVILTWDQVRDLVRRGMSLGGHTVNHVFLDAVDEAQGLAEIGGSLDRIEAETGIRPMAFAYPKGRTHDRLHAWLTRCGVQAAMTTEPGMNRVTADLLALKRRDAGYLAIQDRFVKAQMGAEMVGLWDRLRGTTVSSLRAESAQVMP